MRVEKKEGGNRNEAGQNQQHKIRFLELLCCFVVGFVVGVLFWSRVVLFVSIFLSRKKGSKIHGRLFWEDIFSEVGEGVTIPNSSVNC